MSIRSSFPVRSLCQLSVALLFVSTYAAAQSQVQLLFGDEAADYFGISIASVGDVNADGVPDFGVGGYRGFTGRGRINVYSGDDGSLIHNIFGLRGENLGFVETTGDVNGDGFDDFAGNGLHNGGWLFSGLDGSILREYPGSIRGDVGDFDGDGLADYVVSAEVISGATGQPLTQLVGTHNSLYFIGDVTADGIPDYVTRSLQSGSITQFQARSGVDNALLYQLSRVNSSAPVALGDVNADGITDWGFWWRNAFENGVQVEAVSGVDGTTVLRLRDLELHNFSFEVLGAAGDADGDGHSDLILATVPPRLFSGRTGGVLGQFIRDDGARTAWSASGVPDANGDGRSEVILGNPAISGGPNFGGTAALFSYDGLAGQSYCMAALNSTGRSATLAASGSTSLTANNLLLAVHDAPASSIGIFLMGTGQQQVALGDGFLCVGAGGAGIARLPIRSIDANGHLIFEFDHLALPVGASALTAGATRNFQAWFRDASPTGAQSNLSDAVSVTFTP